jgi:large subunit ribosomal protein L4
MANIDIKDVSGKKVGTAELNPAVFEIEPNVHVMHTVMRSIQAGWRQGTHSTKTRGKVSGGGRKPWRQKGTGHARQGSIRAPQWRGGGVVWGPHPRSYAFRVNRKEVNLAMRSALSAKYADNEIIVVDALDFEKPSTKQADQILKALGCDRRTTVVIPNNDLNSYLSLRNIERVRVVTVHDANMIDLVDNKKLLLTKSTLEKLEEVLA